MSNSKNSEPEHKLSLDTSKNLLGTFSLSYILAFLLLAFLIYNAEFYNVASNTRVLDLLIDAGIVQYTDKDAGIIEGVGHLKHYLYSQDPIKWNMVFIVFIMFLGIWGLRAIQFSVAARFHGLKGTTGENARAFFYGRMFSNFFPFQFGDMAKASALETDDPTYSKTASTLFTTRVVLAIEIGFFAFLGLFYMGWGNWIYQLFWAFFIAFVAYRISHGKGNWRDHFPAMKKTLSELNKDIPTFAKLVLLSLFAFALEDLAVYFCAQAFTSPNVILNVEFDVLLMALVAGYIARLFPLTPGGLGQFEWGFAAALYIGGLGFPEAATIALLDNFFRYGSLFVIFLFTTLRYKLNTHFSKFAKEYDAYVQSEAKKEKKTKKEKEEIPATFLAVLPNSIAIWHRTLVFALLLVLLFLFDELTVLLMDKWLLDSLSLSSVFWTNFKTGLLLFLLAGIPCAVGIILPAYVHNVSNELRKVVRTFATIAGLLGGYFVAIRYKEFLLMTHAQSFGEVDPIFGTDLSFYLNKLDALWIIWTAVAVSMGLGLLSNIYCAYNANREMKTVEGIPGFLARISTKSTLINFIVFGVVLAVGEWMTRYDLLLKDNENSAIYNGAEYVDIVGFFSNLNYIWITSLVIVAVTVVLAKMFHDLREQAGKVKKQEWQGACWKMGKIALLLIVVDFGFKGMIVLRDEIFVSPNEPVIQMQYIQQHLDSTRKAYGVDKVEVVNFTPSKNTDPKPSLSKLLGSATLRNTPLWPGYVHYLDTFTDPQHSQRIIHTGGDTMVYGPSLEIFRQEQKLRTYYNFLNVDQVRYKVNGEKKMYVSAVRELPLLEPQPWLAWWGQRFVLFTHGHGLVMAEAAGLKNGNPIYTSKDIPSKSDANELTVQSQDVYYGEGSATMAYSNVKNMREFHYPTEQHREEIVLSKDVKTGVTIDSLLKRIVIGWRSNQLVDIIFSDLIENTTRVLYLRTPIERVERIAPFLHFDTNPYAVAADGKIVWMLNAVTCSDRYPYSKHEYIGDKSAERTFKRRPSQRVNYVEDSVKITVDAYTGEVRLYKYADKPLINTLARIYPDLFTDKKEMSEAVRAHVTYSVHLFHVQFDDIYNVYHMEDAITFFNMEDMWDDADEVLGPIMDVGKSITFSIEPYCALLETGGALPEAKEKLQFALMAVYTPEKAMNLRAIPMAYQDGDDYGRLISLQIPKGDFVLSPEQADALIDQNRTISEKISWWNRQGAEVIRGHTMLLVVDKEILYVEPLFIRSEQNAATQLKSVVVVFRGEAFMGENLEEALQNAVGK